jgi:hypothetical protein
MFQKNRKNLIDQTFRQFLMFLMFQKNQMTRKFQ